LPLHFFKASVLPTTMGASHDACGFNFGRQDGSPGLAL
jgi:hypothetical protein